MASQYYNGKKEEWKVASMCGLYKFEQGLSKRPFPYASDKPASGCHYRPSSDAIVGHPQMSFLDGVQRCHQILLALDD